MAADCTIYTTTFPGGKKHTDTQRLRFTPDTGIEKEVVNLHPHVQFQEFEGFGGAFTDSAGYIYSLMNDEQKKQLLNAYYGEGGLGYTLGRTHLDSCDFSMGHYQAIENANDTEMKAFTLERTEQYILPMLQDAQSVFGSSIPLLAAPWSPPAFMKTNGQRNGGGALKDEYRAFYANYLCRYILQLRKAGANVVRLTTQNEPNATQTWDSCLYTPLQEKEFIRDYLYPALQQNGLADVELFIWDHNKERVFERSCEVLDADTDAMIAGIAFHWYSGDHFEALDLVHNRFPNKKMVQSEACIEYSLFSPEDFLANAQKYAHDIIGDLNGGMTAFYDWNLVLNEEGGPNHVANYCDAPFLFHTKTGELEERATYAYLGHFSRHIKPGAKRIGFSRYRQEVEVTAFENPDKSIIAVFLNRTKESMPVIIRINGQITNFHLSTQSIATIVLTP